MPSLRDYRDRIKSVKSTKKITSAMKMVAASKLRRAQAQAEAAQPYAQTMADMMARVAGNVTISASSSPLLVGTGKTDRHLLVVVSADRGLCGGFNANLIKLARKKAFELLNQDKEVSIVCVGRRGRDAMRRDFSKDIWESYIGVTGKTRVEFADAHEVTDFILGRFDNGDFDVCTLIYNEFESVLAQPAKAQQIIPFDILSLGDEGNDSEEGKDGKENEDAAGLVAKEETVPSGPISMYDFEPEEDVILSALLPRNIGVQIFRALLDSAAGEQAARMTAMDNSTRNANDMIDDLSLAYNRARQAHITKELIEIISGAEAV